MFPKWPSGATTTTHTRETFTFQVNGKTIVVEGRQNLTPHQRAAIEEAERLWPSAERLFDLLAKL
jgi:hypothetical protein